MVNSETDRMLQEFGQRLQTQGMNLELYYQFSGQSEEDLRGQMKEEAESRVRVSLTLEAIADAKKLSYEADIEAELEKMAAQFNMTKEQITVH
ncbi:Trigger factor OS=Lysinibacillus sphaericus OX=1421 GN=tig PE=3 SV=1 [Lysinibacillus sphaericus]